MKAGALRSHALSLPGAVEQETWGDATFRVRGKIFCILAPDERSASLKASLDDQEALVATRPRTYSVAPYVGRYGWISVRLPGADPDEVRDLITQAWRMTAGKRAAAAFDA